MMSYVNWQEGEALTVWYYTSQALESAQMRANYTGLDVQITWSDGYRSGFYTVVKPNNLNKT